MTEENVQQDNPQDKQVEEQVFGTSDNFFEALDDSVNGAIQDQINEAVRTCPQCYEERYWLSPACS